MDGTVLKTLKVEVLTKKFQTEHITPDIVWKLSVHEMVMFGKNSRSDMMSLRIECTKFGGEAPKKVEGTCGAPIFFIPQSVLGDLLQEGYTIKKISYCVREYSLRWNEAIRTEQVRVH